MWQMRPSRTALAPELITIWKDGDFNPKHKAFYYGRVLEIPTPRWTTYDAKSFSTEFAEGHPVVATGARLHLAHLVLAGQVRPRPTWEALKVPAPLLAGPTWTDRKRDGAGKPVGARACPPYPHTERVAFAIPEGRPSRAQCASPAPV